MFYRCPLTIDEYIQISMQIHDFLSELSPALRDHQLCVQSDKCPLGLNYLKLNSAAYSYYIIVKSQTFGNSIDKYVTLKPFWSTFDNPGCY